MNVAFFGTSDRSIPILNSLKDSEFNLVLCVTKKDRKVGRKQNLEPTAVKVWADQNKVQCVTTKALDIESTRQIEAILTEEKVELGVVADFSFMLPEELFNLPEHKFVNIHFSLLPKYRGASPVQWAILNQEEKTGISYQIIDKKMDEGPIIHQTEYPLDSSETTESLYNTLFELCAQELPSILKAYVKGIKKPREQNHSHATYTYSPSHPKNTHIFKEDAKINLKKKPKKVAARIRAFNPWPIAWTTLGEFGDLKKGKNAELRVKIYETRIENEKLVIEKLQVEGKNMLDWKEFENGYLDLDSS